MRRAVEVPVTAQTAAFRTPDHMPCFTRLPELPDGMETIQLPRSSFEQFGRIAASEGLPMVVAAAAATPLITAL
jgi:hypothetical protein